MARPAIGYVGVIQVPLSQLRFVKWIGERLYNKRQTDRLQTLFRKTYINHQNHRHWIDGYIDVAEELSFFSDLGGSRLQLQQSNANGIYPCVYNHVICYTQGRHRIEAAKNLDPSSWWTVSLSCVCLADIHSIQTVNERTEQYQHEALDSDGHIYSKLREHTGKEVDFFEWHERLSKTKQDVFQSINCRRAIADTLDKLIHLPGVINFLQLGSFKNIFYYRLDEELLAGLQYTYAEWSKLTCASQFMQKAIDRDTAVILEGLAPTASRADLQRIQMAFETGQVFQSVTEPQQRLELQNRVQSTPSMIPSLRSLQSNMLYLSIAADIIWRLILSQEIRQGARKERKSLRETLRSCWVASAPYVEVQEGEFRPAQGPPSFNLSYNQLILAALRQFPCLSKSEPKIEKGIKPLMSADASCVALFHRRAMLLGFRTPAATRGAAVQAPPFHAVPWIAAQEMHGFDEAKFLHQVDRRWGRPHARAFQIIQTAAFLPTIAQRTARPRIHVLYAFQDMLKVFLEPCTYEYDSSKACIFLNQGGSAYQGPGGALNMSASWGTKLCNIVEKQREHVDNSGYDLGVAAGSQSVMLQRRECTSSDTTMCGNGDTPAPVRDPGDTLVPFVGHQFGDLGSRGPGPDGSLRPSGCPEVISVTALNACGTGAFENGIELKDKQAPDHQHHLWSEASTCSRSALPSPMVFTQGRLEETVSEELHRSSTMSHASFRIRSPIQSTPATRRPHQWDVGISPRLDFNCAVVQKEGENVEDFGGFYLHNSLSLSRSILPTPMRFPRTPTGSFRTNSEESLRSSQCQEAMDGMRLPYPSQLMQAPSYARRQPSPSIANTSASSRSTLPSPNFLPEPGHTSGCQQDTIDPQVLQNIHESLRSARNVADSRGAPLCQGFVGCDDDLESIPL